MNHHGDLHTRNMRTESWHETPKKIKFRYRGGSIRVEAFRIIKRIQLENKATSDVVDSWDDYNKRKARMEMIAAAHKKAYAV